VDRIEVGEFMLGGTQMEEVRRKAATLIGAGMRIAEVAANCGLHRRTISAWKANAEFKQLVAEAGREYRQLLVSRLVAGPDRETAA
jgi:hypothetical protein